MIIPYFLTFYRILFEFFIIPLGSPSCLIFSRFFRILLDYSSFSHILLDSYGIFRILPISSGFFGSSLIFSEFCQILLYCLGYFLFLLESLLSSRNMTKFSHFRLNCSGFFPFFLEFTLIIPYSLVFSQILSYFLGFLCILSDSVGFLQIFPDSLHYCRNLARFCRILWHSFEFRQIFSNSPTFSWILILSVFFGFFRIFSYRSRIQPDSLISFCIILDSSGFFPILLEFRWILSDFLGLFMIIPYFLTLYRILFDFFRILLGSPSCLIFSSFFQILLEHSNFSHILQDSYGFFPILPISSGFFGSSPIFSEFCRIVLYCLGYFLFLPESLLSSRNMTEFSHFLLNCFGFFPFLLELTSIISYSPVFSQILSDFLEFFCIL